MADCPIAPVTQDHPAQPVLTRRRQLVKSVRGSHECQQHVVLQRQLAARQLPRVLPVELRPPDHGQQLGMRVTRGHQQLPGRGTHTVKQQFKRVHAAAASTLSRGASSHDRVA